MSSYKDADFAIYPPQDPWEFEKLCQLVRELQPRTILEVGSRHGRSLIRLVEAAFPAVRRVVSIDLPGQAWGKEGSDSSLSLLRRHLEGRGVLFDLELIDSHGGEAGLIAEELLEDVDFCFLDGDHTIEGVRMDFERFSPCVKPGGVIAFHDIAGNPRAFSGSSRMGVPQFWKSTRGLEGWGRDELIAPDTRFGIGILKRMNAEPHQRGASCDATGSERSAE